MRIYRAIIYKKTFAFQRKVHVIKQSKKYIYKLVHNGDCVNKGKKYSHRSGDYVYYDDYDIHAVVDASYDGVSFDLLTKFYDDYSQNYVDIFFDIDKYKYFPKIYKFLNDNLLTIWRFLFLFPEAS